MSVSLFIPHVLTEIRLSVISLVLDELSFSNFLETFLVCFYTISILSTISCLLSVCWLAYIIMEIELTQGYIRFWMSYPSQIFWRHSLVFCTLILNNFRFLVCLSVCSLTHFLTENRLSVIYQVLDELSFSNSLEIFQGCL